MNALKSTLIWLAIAFLILIWLPLLTIIRLFDRDPAHYATGRMFRRLGAAMSRVNPFWQINIEGDIPANMRLPYVVVSNHQSLGDIPLLSRLPWEMKWVAKAELFRIPIVGWMMRLASDIPVDRGNPASRASVLIRARKVLDNKCSVMFFPEGTRSKDGNLRPFQPGAFRLAIESGIPILPIALDGTMKAIPKHGWKFGDRILARVQILPPIDVSTYSAENAQTLAETVRDLINARIFEWRSATSPPQTPATLASGHAEPLGERKS